MVHQPELHAKRRSVRERLPCSMFYYHTIFFYDPRKSSFACLHNDIECAKELLSRRAFCSGCHFTSKSLLTMKAGKTILHCMSLLQIEINHHKRSLLLLSSFMLNFHTCFVQLHNDDTHLQVAILIFRILTEFLLELLEVDFQW